MQMTVEAFGLGKKQSYVLANKLEIFNMDTFSMTDM